MLGLTTDNRFVLGGVIAGAMIINMIVAGVAGVVLPYSLDYFKGIRLLRLAFLLIR